MRRRRSGHGDHRGAAVLTAPAADLDALGRELASLVDRLRTLGPARLATPWEPGRPSRADVAHDLAAHLAGLAERAEARAEARPAVDRPLPRVGDHAVADQLAVTGQDLLAALRELPAPDVADVCRQAEWAIRALRAALP